MLHGKIGDMLRLTAALTFSVLLVSACSPRPAVPAASKEYAPVTVSVSIQTPSGKVSFLAEVVDSQKARERGLMFRESLPPDRGMLFIFPNEAPRTFWMKNTLVPLDIIFIRTDKTILGIIANAKPRSLTPLGVPGKSQFVLEIAAGRAQASGLRAGQLVDF